MSGRWIGIGIAALVWLLVAASTGLANHHCSGNVIQDPIDWLLCAI